MFIGNIGIDKKMQVSQHRLILIFHILVVFFCSYKFLLHFYML